MKKLLNSILLLLATFIISACGGGGSNNKIDNNSNSNSASINSKEDEFNKTQYKGLIFYYKNLPTSAYKLEPLSDSDFNALSEAKKLKVANKLLNTLFFAYPLNELKDKISKGDFISSIKDGLEKDSINREWLENFISSDENFKQYHSR